MSCKADVCPCLNKSCKNFGKCCDCVAFHIEKPKPPACLRK